MFCFFMLIFSYHNLLKDFPFFHCLALVPLSKIDCPHISGHLGSVWYADLCFDPFVKNTVTYFVFAVGSECSSLTFVLQSSWLFLSS